MTLCYDDMSLIIDEVCLCVFIAITVAMGSYLGLRRTSCASHALSCYVSTTQQNLLFYNFVEKNGFLIFANIGYLNLITLEENMQNHYKQSSIV